VLQRKQVAVAGIAGSGKSTLVNRFLKEHGYEGGPPRALPPPLLKKSA
jgi:GTPase SAR1 family protein